MRSTRLAPVKAVGNRTAYAPSRRRATLVVYGRDGQSAEDQRLLIFHPPVDAPTGLSESGCGYSPLG